MLPNEEICKNRKNQINKSQPGMAPGSLRRYQVSIDELAQLNHLTTPAELYAGFPLMVPTERVNAAAGMRTFVTPGQSLLELAVLNGTNPWAVVISNDLPGTWGVLPGDVLHLPGSEKDGPGALPEAIAAVNLNPSPFIEFVASRSCQRRAA